MNIIHPSHLQTRTNIKYSPAVLPTSWKEDIPKSSSSIQAYGALLVLQEPSLNIVQVSDNTFKLLGLHPEKLIGSNLNLLMESFQIERLKDRLKQENLETINPLKLHLKTQRGFLEFDGIVHRSNGLLLLELEPNPSTKNPIFLNSYHLIKSSINRLHDTSSLQELCQVAALEFRKISQFNRVMVYKFDWEGNGTVVAEEKGVNGESFLGLNYPALDIPESFRNLFLKNRIRVIADIEAQPSKMIPENSTLDLSFSILRGVSPCHVEYLRNMEVRSSMVISLLKENRLWGLIVCHHQSPKYLNYELRAACEFLGHVMSVELGTKEDRKDYEYRLEIKSIQSQLLESMSQADSLLEGLIQSKNHLLDLVSAQGAAICIGREITLLGDTPSLEKVQKLMTWLRQESFRDRIFYTNSLAKLNPEAEQLKDVASGLLAVEISPNQQKYVLWFRPEIIQTVNWAGNPNPETYIGADGNLQLSPRKSFELWKETVKCTSLRWQTCEREAALELRQGMIGIVLRKADELAELNAALKQSEAQERDKAECLKKALEELKQTQTQLIQTEKMSSLGQLVAGVAHELNNPVNFIYGNLSYADEYTQNLLELVELYAQYYPSPHPQIQEKAEEVELDFLLEDLPKLLGSIKLGAERICKLVHSLRNFSRLDETEMKPVDIHEGIDNTLVILNNRLKAKPEHPGITLLKEYGELPLVECYASQLNQVFMNLIANSIDALEEGDRGRSYAEIQTNPSTITIRTELIRDDWVAIAIQDNGMGIPQEIQSKLFDPFFTTKPIGKGTGLGLAISYQIVEKHQGQLRCISKPGEGTTFRVDIPLKARV